jgi:hypothetical protein
MFKVLGSMFNVQCEIRGQFPISSLIYIEVMGVQGSRFKVKTYLNPV